VGLLVAGCSTGFQTVPVDQWRTVPVAQRDTMERTAAAEASAADHELQTATAALTAAQHGSRAARRGSAPATAAQGEWGAALREHEQTKRGRLAEIDGATAGWQRADLTWKQQRRDAAIARIEVVRCEREYDRAKAIDRNLLGEDSFEDLPVFRGQLARAQVRYYALASGVAQSRQTVEFATAKLASSKEAYAQLMRSGPALPPSLEDRLQLGDLTLSAMRHLPPPTAPHSYLVGNKVAQRYVLTTALASR
jgi:hypothetical protein